MLAAVALSLLVGITPLPANDTIKVKVGSPLLDASYFRPHAARVRVYRGPEGSAPVSEWTNELTLADSAGRAIHRWVTRGTRTTPNGTTTWELLQTYDAKTLQPYAYLRRSSDGGFTQFSWDGKRVHGSRKAPQDSVARPFEQTVDQPGFFAGASDLVPLAAGLKRGVIVSAPVWSPGMQQTQTRTFIVIGKSTVNVEGTPVESWKVEERMPDGKLYANWYLLDRIPYMVYGEVMLPDGSVQRMTEVTIPALSQDKR
ncbi:MAG TPA: hypothetical protein VEB19_14680 [Gemmatimonadaceae bacterium]|nr:hypothetical protein [Gemmatimonadaceae bacterium]